jgi:hypothetical protein
MAGNMKKKSTKKRKPRIASRTHDMLLCAIAHINQQDQTIKELKARKGAK